MLSYKSIDRRFLEYNDSFNLIQHVHIPTHVHILDLVLSFGLSIDYVEISDQVFSDHESIIFKMLISHQKVKPINQSRPRRVSNVGAVEQLKKKYFMKSIFAIYWTVFP